jgi:hypothetical protein
MSTVTPEITHSTSKVSGFKEEIISEIRTAEENMSRGVHTIEIGIKVLIEKIEHSFRRHIDPAAPKPVVAHADIPNVVIGGTN